MNEIHVGTLVLGAIVAAIIYRRGTPKRHHNQRMHDLNHVWPKIKQSSDNLGEAHHRWFNTISRTPAWYKHYTYDELRQLAGWFE